METANSTTPWTVTDLTPAQPEAKPERLTARQDLTKVLTEWSARHDLPFDRDDIGVDDDEDLTVTLIGLTLEGDDIVPNSKDYEYEAVLTVEVRVRSTVTARNEDEATEFGEDEARDFSLSVESWDGTVTHYEVIDSSVAEVEEV